MFKAFVNHSWEGTVSQAVDLKKKKAFWLATEIFEKSFWVLGQMVIFSPSSSEDWPLELPCHPTWKSCWTQFRTQPEIHFGCLGFSVSSHTSTDLLGSAPNSSHSPPHSGLSLYSSPPVATHILLPLTLVPSRW